MNGGLLLGTLMNIKLKFLINFKMYILIWHVVCVWNRLPLFSTKLVDSSSHYLVMRNLLSRAPGRNYFERFPEIYGL